MGKNTKRHKVSIITTFYNAEKFIINAISSVNQQIINGFDVEYVIVDDKSPDNSRTIVEQFIKVQGNPKIDWRLIEPEVNLGCGGARKFGIDNATGDYFMFLDADDYYIHNDFVYRAYNDIRRENADIVEYGVLFNTPNGQQMNNSASQRFEIKDYKTAEVALFKDNLIKFNVWTKIYTRAIVETYPYSTTRTYEDVRTIPVWITNTKKIVIMPTPEINYRAATNSIIREDQVKTRLGTITAIAELFENPKFNCDIQIMKAMYGRAMVDLEAILHNHSSNDVGFNEMSRLNTKMLSYIYPNNYKDMTFHIEDVVEDTDQSDKQTQDNKQTKDISDYQTDGVIDLNKIPGWDD